MGGRLVRTTVLTGASTEVIIWLKSLSLLTVSVVDAGSKGRGASPIRRRSMAGCLAPEIDSSTSGERCCNCPEIKLFPWDISIAAENWRASIEDFLALRERLEIGDTDS